MREEEKKRTVLIVGSEMVTSSDNTNAAKRSSTPGMQNDRAIISEGVGWRDEGEGNEAGVRKVLEPLLQHLIYNRDGPSNQMTSELISKVRTPQPSWRHACWGPDDARV